MFPNLFSAVGMADSALTFSDLLTDEAKMKNLAGKAATGALQGLAGGGVDPKEKGEPGKKNVAGDIISFILSNVKFGAPPTKPKSSLNLNDFMQYISQGGPR
jgi:hypothetical protein